MRDCFYLVSYTFSRRYLGLDFIVNCKTVGQNKNIKENKEAPDKSWSVTIANQDTYKSSISTTSMMVLTAGS
jgi:hypothetical protein